MDVDGIGYGYGDDYEIVLCKESAESSKSDGGHRGSVGGSVSTDIEKNGSTNIEFEGHVQYQTESGATISGKGSCTVGNDDQGNITTQGKATISADYPFFIYPFWLRA